MTLRKITYFLAYWVLGIDLSDRYAHLPHDLDEVAKKAIHPSEIYLENEPSVTGLVIDSIPSVRETLEYLWNLFPPAHWVPRYNLRWFLGDLVAGVTAGVVVIPQAMAIASLANVPPEYGLYTSITSGMLYWLFGTSRDVLVGTTAVGALMVNQVFGHIAIIAPGMYTPDQTAHSMCVMTGSVFILLGIFRLGWIIEFIPYVPISAFLTAASVTIISTQVPIILGVTVENKEPPYLVLLSIVKKVPEMKIDAAIGIPSLILLFGIRKYCVAMAKRQPARKVLWSRISSMRLTLVVGIFTLISWIVNRKERPPEVKFAVIGHLDRGTVFPPPLALALLIPLLAWMPANRSCAGLLGLIWPKLNLRLMLLLLLQLPATIIVLAIGHISIGKSMGKAHNYAVDPSQELIALGVCNAFSPFLNGFVCAGSFGASAVLSESGVRTPFAGVFSSLVLVLSIYFLTQVLFYIPKATMASLLIHVVYNLITPPRILYKYWKLSPTEFAIWVSCVSVALFYSLEISIYMGLALSTLMLLLRLARTKGRFLGLTKVTRVMKGEEEDGGTEPDPGTPTLASSSWLPRSRFLFFPLDHKDASHPELLIEAPYPGIFVYRLSEGFNYTNQAYHVEILSGHIMKNTRPISIQRPKRRSERLWNDSGPKKHQVNMEELPFLRAVVLDFAAVNNTDVTSVQGLVELRKDLDRHAAPDAVEWHFANVHNPWTRRALAIAGFGYPTSQNEGAMRHWQPVYSIAAVGDEGDLEEWKRRQDMEQAAVLERPIPGIGIKWAMGSNTPGVGATRGAGTLRKRTASVSAVDRPFFHVDLHDAVDSAVRDAQSKDGDRR